ncbi:hypothetical protein EV359DRAFT_81687 [Lentinula novae-zelandiae]|nr:hypothetical protein EV359DRAFT_81687 [Lentinula novae-zelandiae]
MATALGVASAIYSLADLTYKSICYIRSVKNAPKEAQDVARELQAMNVYLSDLKDLVKSGGENKPWAESLYRLDADGGSFTRLFVLLTTLSQKIKKPKSRWLKFKNRTMWPIIGKEEVENLIQSIRRVIALLMAAVQLDGIKLDIAIKEDLEAVRADVRVVRDHTDYDHFVDISRWLLRILDPDLCHSFSNNVSKLVFSEKLHNSLVQYSSFVIPKCQRLWVQQLPVSDPKQMDIVRYTSKGNDNDSLILRILPIYAVDILLDEGISIAWKALYETATRSGTQPDILAILLADELDKVQSFQRPTEVDFLVRAKRDSVPIPGWTYFGFVTGQVMHVSLLFADGTCWAESGESAGHILTSLVDIIDPNNVDSSICAQFGSDFYARIRTIPTASTPHGCPGNLVHLFLEETGGYWWGERNGVWEWVSQTDVQQLESVFDVCHVVLAQCDFPSQCDFLTRCHCLAYNKGELIRITKECSDGWWWGEMGDNSGWVWWMNVKGEDNISWDIIDAGGQSSDDEGCETPEEGA